MLRHIPITWTDKTDLLTSLPWEVLFAIWRNHWSSEDAASVRGVSLIIWVSSALKFERRSTFSSASGHGYRSAWEHRFSQLSWVYINRRSRNMIFYAMSTILLRVVNISNMSCMLMYVPSYIGKAQERPTSNVECVQRVSMIYNRYRTT